MNEPVEWKPAWMEASELDPAHVPASLTIATATATRTT